ncbi:hypothetical protein ACU686_10500 [Yinghuangia aomiensis]
MVGSRFPVGSTGMGRVLLAHAPRHIQDAVLDGPLRSWTPPPSPTRRRCAASWSASAASRSSSATGSCRRAPIAVAAAVRIGRTGPVTAALGIVIAAGNARPGARAARTGAAGGLRDLRRAGPPGQDHRLTAFPPHGIQADPGMRFRLAETRLTAEGEGCQRSG